MTAEPDYGPSPLLDTDVFVRDMTSSTTTRVSLRSNGTEADPNRPGREQGPRDLGERRSRHLHLSGRLRSG